VTALRRRAGVYVSSSRFECCAYAVMETLAMGCPVLATATYGAAEFLANNEEIMIAPVDDAEALAEKLNALVGNPALAAEIGAAGRLAAMKRFSPEKIAAAGLEIYRRAASSGGG
jgi:glycosyltransferase involved in cell wall biosynthesis